MRGRAGKVINGLAHAGSRQYMASDPDEVMVSIAASDLGRIIAYLGKMKSKMHFINNRSQGVIPQPTTRESKG